MLKGLGLDFCDGLKAISLALVMTLVIGSLTVASPAPAAAGFEFTAFELF